MADSKTRVGNIQDHVGVPLVLEISEVLKSICVYTHAHTPHKHAHTIFWGCVKEMQT